MTSLTTDYVGERLEELYRSQQQIPFYDADYIFSLPVFIIVGHSTYSLDVDEPLRVMEVPHHSFLCHPSPPGSYCLYAGQLNDESNLHILKQSKEKIITSIFDSSKKYTSRINIIKENDEGMRIPSMIRGNRPGFFLPNSIIIDKEISFMDDDAPNPADRGLLNSGYGVFRLDHMEEPIDRFAKIGYYDRRNLFMKHITRAGGRKLATMISRKKTLRTSEIMNICGPGIYIVMSCAELNLYKRGKLIDEEREPRFYRSVREMLNKYHHFFSKQWDDYCEPLDIREIVPIEMSVQNQPFSSKRRPRNTDGIPLSKYSKIGKHKKTKRPKKKNDKKLKKKKTKRQLKNKT